MFFYNTTFFRRSASSQLETAFVVGTTAYLLIRTVFRIWIKIFRTTCFTKFLLNHYLRNGFGVRHGVMMEVKKRQKQLTWWDLILLSTFCVKPIFLKNVFQCNNPLTKEPKLNSAKRIIKEWTEYDSEISKVLNSADINTPSPSVDRDELWFSCIFSLFEFFVS